MNEKLMDYFKGDSYAIDVWCNKYQMKDSQGNAMEETPDDMHRRLAKEFARVEYDYTNVEITNDGNKINNLSDFGEQLFFKRMGQRSSVTGLEEIEKEFYDYFKDFKHIVPQGSIMANLGNPYVFGSLSNCFVVESPFDSYGGILRTDEELAQLMKRRKLQYCVTI